MRLVAVEGDAVGVDAPDSVEREVVAIDEGQVAHFLAGRPRR